MIQRRRKRGRDDVLERHVDDRHGDERLDQRRKPQRARRHVVGGRDERDRVGDGEGGDDRHQRADAAERNHQAEQEQQVIHAAQDVEEPVHDEAPRRLEPARIQRHDARVAVELERALGSARGQQSKRGRGSQAGRFEPRLDRQARRGRSRADTRTARPAGPARSPPRCPAGSGSPVTWSRARSKSSNEVSEGSAATNATSARRTQPPVVLVEIDAVGHPPRGGFPKHRLGPRQVQEDARAPATPARSWRPAAPGPAAAPGCRRA